MAHASRRKPGPRSRGSSERYALVACISGRTGEDARRLVGVDGVRYVGSHGLELEPEAADWRERIRSFAAGVDWPVEDKGLTVSFHYREAADEEAALAYLEEVAERARAGRPRAALRPEGARDQASGSRRQGNGCRAPSR